MRLRSLVVALFSTAMLTTVACGSSPKYNLPVDSPFLPYEPPPEVADNQDDGEDDPEIPDDPPADDGDVDADGDGDGDGAAEPAKPPAAGK